MINQSLLNEVKQDIIKKVDQILDHFIEGSKITLIIRQPDDDDADFTLSNDDWIEIKKVADRCLNGSNKNDLN